MKYFNYPYPVLSISGEDIEPKPLAEKPFVSEDEEGGCFVIRFKFLYENPDIQRLIKEGKAEYCCEVECPHTFFRTRLYGDSADFCDTVPFTNMGDDIYFSFTIVVKADELAYTNSRSHSDYAGYTFPLQKGDVLGYFGRFRFHAELKANQFNATSDFLSIEEGENSVYPEFDFNGDKVVLKLPSEQYSMFMDIRNNAKYEETLLSTFALQTLTEAIHEMNNSDRYHGKKWCKALSDRIAFLKSAYPDLDEGDAFKIAQIILTDDNQPFYRMLGKISKKK